MSSPMAHLPSIILVAGLPASGKTTFANSLANRLGAVRINSDLVRQQLDLKGHYSPEDKKRVYQAMIDRAADAIAKGHSVVADSTFYKEALRKPWIELARRAGVEIHFVVMEIPDEEAFHRLQKPRPDSEATWEVYQELKSAWEPLAEPHITLDSTSGDVDALVEEVLVKLRKSN